MEFSRNGSLYGAARGAFFTFPLVILSMALQLLVGQELFQRPVFGVLTFICNPTSPFCTPLQKLLCFAWILLIGALGSLFFAKERNQRLGFIVSFSLLFWIVDFLATFLFALIDLFVLPIFRVSAVG